MVKDILESRYPSNKSPYGGSAVIISVSQMTAISCHFPLGQEKTQVAGITN